MAAQATLLDDIADLTDDVARAAEPAARVDRRPRADPHRPQRRQRGLAVGGRGAGRAAGPVPGGLEQRAGDIEAGAGRPAAELVRDVRDNLQRRRASDGRPFPGGVGCAVADVERRGGDSRDAVLSRWREVVVHHGDLGLGPVPFPPALVEVWLPRELPRLAETE